MNLNQWQQQAVEDMSRACLVNACVGSGKTTVLTAKVRYLNEVKKVPYENMMVLTFTNKAAGEILERLGIETDPSDSGPMFGTFHSIARRLLQEKLPLQEKGYEKDFEILEPEQELELVESLIREHKLKVKYKNRLEKRLNQEKDTWKKGGSPRYNDDLFLLYPLLEAEKKRRNVMSFDDLLEVCCELFAEGRKKGTFFCPDWLIVDEVQDCSPIQVEMLQALYGRDTSLFAVGDPNQMIYSFRGGDQTLFYHIREAFQAKELSLPVNYRSSQAILAVANRFRQFGTKVEGNAVHFSTDEEKKLTDQKRIPVHNYYDPFQEAELLGEKIRKMHEEGTAYEDVAILYRLQEQGEQLEKTFERMGIPSNSVNFLTLHASKGLEFDVVFIIGINMGLIPLHTKDQGQREEEQRLFYVGLTRARKYLELSWYTNPNQPQALGDPSPFIESLRHMSGNLVDLDEAGLRSSEDKRGNLQRLRREVQQEQKRRGENTGEKPEETQKPIQAEAGPSLKKAVHPKYGEGTVTFEDDMTVKVSFPGYGEKEFLKMFGEVEILDF